MANRVYIASSLDGFIATKDGGIDWLNDLPNPERSDYGYSEFIESIDAIIMGRKTFETVLNFDPWPYNKPVFVLSNTISEIPEELKDRMEIVKGEIRTILQDLIQRGYHDLYIDGGGAIQSFLKEDLIDEMIITRVPILLGDGIPLFRNLRHTLKFKHIKTIVYNDDLVKSHYKRKK